MRLRGVTLVGPLPPPSGGIATHVVDVQTFLLRRGIPCRVLVPRRDPSFFAALAWLSLRDLVHVHVHGHSARAWLLAALGSGAPRAALTIHSGLAPAYVAAHPARVRAACSGYRAVVAVSTALRDTLLAAGVSRSRLWVAPAFVREALGDRLAPAGLAELRRRHPTLLCAAAASGREYGLDVLLAAFGRIRQSRPDAGLVLFGPGLRQPALRRPGLYLLGELPRREALGVVEACDALLRPTLADGDATSVREALALGRRVITSDASVRPRGVFLHRAGDAVDLAQVTLSALGQPAPRLPCEGAAETLFSLYRALDLRPPAPADVPFPVDEETPCAESPAA